MRARAPDRARAARITVFQQRLKGLAHESARALYRSTRSPLFLNGDFAIGFLDAAGRMIEQEEHLPLMAFALHPGCQAIIEAFGDDIAEGDVFMHNDVWHRNLQHADVGFYLPVFAGGRRVAWIGCRGHWADIGGAVLGGCNPDAIEVFQEALRIPPVRVVERGRERRDVWELIFSNVRLREVVEADARAQIGAAGLGRRLLLELVEREGPDAFEADVAVLHATTERRVRALIASLPDGDYQAEASVWLDRPEGLGETVVRLEARVRGDGLELDFTGSDDQTRSLVNASRTCTCAAAMVALLYLLPPDLPHNEGTLRPVTVTTREGSVLDARFPAATFMGNKLCQEITDVVMTALADVLPDRVTAGWGRRLSYRVGGTDPRTGRTFHDVFFLTYEGGGASRGADGYNQPGLLGGGNVLSQDYEVFEVQNALHLLAHEYVTDSAGAGRWRGGLGTRTVVRSYGEGVEAAIHGEGTVEPARGLQGGRPGTLSSIELRLPDGRVHRSHALEAVPSLPPGTVSIHLGGGGGGFGPPWEREVAAVRDDVANGFVSSAASERDYGVVLAAGGTVDAVATARRRAAMREEHASARASTPRTSGERGYHREVDGPGDGIVPPGAGT